MYRILYFLLIMILALACSEKIYEYYDDGSVKSLKHLKKGKVISEKTWHSNGSIEYHLEEISMDTIEQASEKRENEIEIIVARSCKWNFFYNSGQIKEQGLVRLGKKEGIWRYWDEQGNLIKEELYKEGELQ